ncbi:MAG: endolytic transglycosylase MltG, partial [Dehalococcoidia bacterium]
MRTRDPQAIAVLVFALVAAAVTVLALGRIFGADDAVAATIEAGASRPSGAVTFDGEARVVISEGALPDEIVTILARAGVSSDAETLRTLLHFTGAGGELLAGEYRFALGTPPAEIIRRLRGGPDQIERITFRTGLRVEEIGEILEREGYFSAQEWDAAIEEEPPRDFMGDETDFLGYLMPGTYEIEDRTTAESLLAAMLDRFAEEVPDSLVAEAEEQGWTLYEVVTLASVVEREAVHPEEKAVIAAAFRNRLDEGIALQADAT